MKQKFTRTLLSVSIASMVMGVAHAADTGGVEEVVITAQKRTEKLKDVAVSAQVMSADKLTQSNATDISDINNLVPSVQLKGSINGRVPMAMRGVSTNAEMTTYGLTSGVAVLIDGVPTSSDSMAANNLNDVQRVEVLKGPQSTLGGRAASAGVINIVTRKPSKTFTSSVSLLATDDDQLRGEAFLSGPISSNVAYSLSAFNDHTKYPMKNLMTGKNSTTDANGVRGKLLISPNEDLDITLAARVGEFKSLGSNFTYQYATFAPMFGGAIPAASGFGRATPYWGNDYYDSLTTAHAFIKDNDLSMNIDWRLGDYTLSSTTARQHETQDTLQDLFISAVPITFGPFAPFGNNMTHDVDVTVTSQEFKVASPLNGPFTYVTGLFMSDTHVKATDLRAFGADLVDRDVDSDTKTTALYGRVTWKTTDKIDIVTGLRYNRDTVSYSIDQRHGGLMFTSVPLASSASSTTSNVVGDLSLQYHFDADNMVYGTIAKGYKPGAYNTSNNLSSNTPLTPVDSEKITHFELGSKGLYFNKQLSVNLALFDTIYKDYQIQVFDSGGAWPSPKILKNAGEAETRGIEADINWRVDPTIRVNFNAAYIDAKFNKFANAPCYPGQTVAQGCTASGTGVLTQDLSGAVMPSSPKFKFTLGAQKQIELETLPYDLTLSANYNWRSKEQQQADQNPYTIQKAFGLLNLSATATSKSGEYAVTLFVNNVTNKWYATDIEDFFSGVYSETNTVIAQPARDAHRYIGVRLNMDF